jgi:hypothetical protein
MGNRYQEYDNARRAVIEMEKSNPSIWGPMQYPTHPFQPDVCAKMSIFPPGLVALCFTGTISCPVINCISMIAENLCLQSPRASEEFETGNRINAAMCIRLLQTLQLSLAERVLLLTIASYCYFKVGDPATWQNADGFIQVSCLRLMSQPLPEGDEKAMLWEAMVLRAAFGYETPAREYSDIIFRKIKMCDPKLVARRYEVATGFFWERGLSEILESVPFNV